MKNEETTILDRVSISAPCNADWDKMVGDERERFCNQCSLNVYNISSMTKAEAEEFLSLRKQGRLCVQFYKRKDGTIITDNCPSGLKALRDKTHKLLKTASAFIALIATSNLFAWGQQNNDNAHPMPTRGKVLVRPESETKPETKTDKNLQTKPASEPASGPKLDTTKIAPLRGEVYVPLAKDDPACFLEAEKTLKDKLAKLESNKNDKLAIARVHLDLASFYRSKNHLQKADDQYSIAVKLLSKLPKETNLYKNAILNKIAVLKHLGKQKDAAALEKSLQKIK